MEKYLLFHCVDDDILYLLFRTVFNMYRVIIYQK